LSCMRPIGASLSRYYYSRMGKGCQHLRHINFQTVATLPTLGTPPGFTNCIPHRHCNHCDQQPTAARRTTVGQQRGNPIHSSSRGGRDGCRGCRGYCACCPCCPTHADCAAPGPPPPPHRITACHPTPQHDTNTPPPPHGRSGQDITGVAVEEEGG